MNDIENIENPGKDNFNGVAIIGMAARLPKAKNIDEYWKNLENKVECITFYQDRQLIDAGIDPETLKHPDYVKAKGEVADVDMFDASFFGINPREAEVTDPQHRMLLECAWEAMEHAGYDSDKYDGPVGVFAGKSMDYYLLLNVYPRIKKEISAGSLQAAIGNDKDSLSTTISYRLNLTGPGITIQTSSSTSLVAVCVACQSLLTYQCDMALAGGITAGPPIKSGYLYQEGNIWSPDGHCRAFDARARGFVPGSGMGMVVLKRLEDALLDRDTIWAVIKGFAVNNDGYNKVSYSAPSVNAQAEVVAQALAAADVHPETIQYIETHGTGTNLGDPIEITALNQAFHLHTHKKHFCAIGSVKTNIGHLDNAAGAAGLIKVTLSLYHKKIPAVLHFETPNPNIDWENSPFFVNAEPMQWKPNTNTDGTPIPRRAGITSLGMGGTNAHIILEEFSEGTGGLAPLSDSPLSNAPLPDAPLPDAHFSRPYQLILLSAKTSTALETKTTELLDFMKTHAHDHDGLNLADIAYTLKVGRRDFNHRRLVLCQDPEDARTALEESTPGRAFTSVCEMVERPVILMFSGQGAQYVNMGRQLYENEPVFRSEMDRCFEILTSTMDDDLQEILYPASNQNRSNKSNLSDIDQTHITQPVLFMLEYALARMWMEWGIQPRGMIGHSIGEFTAACIAGCMNLEDTLKLVVCRGKLMHEQKKGTMLAVEINESRIKEMLTGDLSLAAVNSPRHCVVSGETQAVAQLEKQLKEKNIFCRLLHTSHAFHSPMMEPIMKEFAGTTARVKINPPQIPFISGVTGTWIRDEEVCDPLYWARQLRQPVRFSAGLEEILTNPSCVLLEIGPGNGLCLLAKEHKTNETEPVTFSSIRHIKQTESDLLFLTRTAGNLWLSGVVFDWKSCHKNEKRRRIPLPTYPFERKRYWLEEIKQPSDTAAIEMKEVRSEEKAEAGPNTRPVEEKGTRTFEPRPVLPNEYTAPVDDIQKKIAAIWEDILGIRPIGIHDNFFDLGGHSLLATLFLSQLQEQFQIRLEMRTIFEEPTIACAAELVKKEQNKTSQLQQIEDILKEVEEETI